MAGFVMFEYLQKPNGDETRRIHAWFVEQHEGVHPNVPFPGPTGDEPQCFNYRTLSGTLPLATPEGEVDLDMGPSVTITNDNGISMELARNIDGLDADEMQHPIVYEYLEDGPVPDGYFSQFWTMNVDSSVGANYTDILVKGTFSPPNLNVTAPLRNGSEPVPIDDTQDLQVTWDAIQDPVLPDGVAQLDSLVAFLEPGVGLHTLCLGPADEGQLKVPAEVLADVPDAGVFLLGWVAHSQMLTPDNRLMHQLGRSCQVGPYAKTAN
jgi:hypothetical protein